LGVVSISIGAEQQDVINKLKKEYTLDFSDDKNFITVFSKQGPNSEIIANIAFKDGKVRYIRQYWSIGYKGTNPAPFFRTLYSLIKNYEEDGYRMVASQLGEDRQPDGVSKTIFLIFKGKFGVKRIDIRYGEYQGTQPSVNVDEVLERD